MTLGLAVPSAGRAQFDRSLDLQLYQPPVMNGRTFILDRTAVPRHLNIVAGLAASYANEPFVRDDGGSTTPIVAHLFQADVMATLGLFEWIELGAALPVAVAEVAGDPFAMQVSRTLVGNLSDLRLSMKVPLLRGDFSISGRLVVALPTGDASNFLGSGYWVTTPEVLVGWDLGAVNLGASVAYRLRQRQTLADFEQDDELQIIVGGEVPIITEISIIADTQLRAGVGGRYVRNNEIPWDANVGARFHLPEGFTIEAGAGFGILGGYGAPLARGILTLRYATERDPCSGGPEDFDGWEDGDFCADLDNDLDEIPDAIDVCPNNPEDRDGFSDEDGCPDPDNDADGVLDDADSCPSTSEDLDSFRDEDGCPEPDNDEDGVPDGRDECAMEPEDLDQFQDEDGCPEPGPRAVAVTVTDTRILISERIYFEFDTDTIRSVSTPLLDQVASVIGQLNPQLRIRIEGHSDDQGNQAYNLDLSFRRARAVVEYLVGRGVPRERFEYRGYGSAHPVAPNDSPEGRALNRRVEFTIIHPGDTEPPPETGQTRRRRREGGQ